MEILDDLSELKGLCVKLPHTYESKDDFDCLDNWLQGLLRYFKLHHLTGVDRDADWVLVTETCLTGKAERWFSHEVEHPMQVIHDWTFELVVVGLYTTFITTTMVQQAMQRYTQIQFSCEDGVIAFHHKLMLWAGQLAQYPDKYSFRRHLFGSLPMEYQQHLVLYEGISAKHSSIDDILLKVQHLKKTLILMREGCGFKGQSTQSHATPAVANLQCDQDVTSHSKQCTHTMPVRQPHICNNADQQPIVGARGNTTAPSPAIKRDTLNTTCYRCGKVGHFTSDLKCPQYKKPEQ
jgi:hypothetical protein